MEKPIIFCDFDGTVTMKDNIVSIMAEFAPPEWESLKDGVLSREISIREGVGKMFKLLPTTLKDDIIRFVLETSQVREGFGDFDNYTRENNIPLYIVSGGIDFFVHPMLERFGSFDGIYCNEADFEGDTIKINWPYSCDRQCTNQNCGCCKPTIMRKLSDEHTHAIVIGDSVTDIEAAKIADTVISRDYLTDRCKELGISYEPFHTFYDCIDILEKLQMVKK